MNAPKYLHNPFPNHINTTIFSRIQYGREYNVNSVY
jgi:hypothetical protein